MAESLHTDQLATRNSDISGESNNPIDVGSRLRMLRAGASLSIRALAEMSGNCRARKKAKVRQRARIFFR